MTLWTAPKRREAPETVMRGAARDAEDQRRPLTWCLSAIASESRAIARIDIDRFSLSSSSPTNNLSISTPTPTTSKFTYKYTFIRQDDDCFE